MRLGRRGTFLVLALEVVAFAMLGALMLDVAAHRRDDPYVLNQFGYRGPARAAKRRGELRVVIVGGSAAFGAGTPWSSTIGPALVSAINRTTGVPDDKPFADVQNLAEPQSGPDSYVATLKAYGYLEPDVVVIYDGYDADGGERHGRRQSLLFRLTGYLPIVAGPGRRLPDPERGIAAELTDTFTPAGDGSCAGSFRAYCAAMADTVLVALADGRSVVVVTPPYVTARHQRQQESLATELARLFHSVARFRYVNLGQAVDLHDRAQSLDGVHTTPSANQVIAQALAGPVVAALRKTAFASRDGLGVANRFTTKSAW